MIVVVCILRVSESEILCSLQCDAHYTVYRIPSAFPELKPYATYVHQLVKATSFMLTKGTAEGHVGLTSTIYRNFDFTKMTSKFGENWLMKCTVVFSFWGAKPPPPDLLTRDSAPGPR